MNRSRSLLLLPSLIVVGLVAVSLSAQVTVTKHGVMSPEGKRIRKTVLEGAMRMLKEKKVPFNPNLLLDHGWKDNLKDAFDQMPEMQTDVHVAGPMSGLYLARSILLPERVDLIGETVILAQELAAEDENSKIYVSGDHRLVILVIGNKKQYEAMRRREPTDILRVNVTAPCGLVGIPPRFLAGYRCMGMGFVGND